MHCCKDCGAQFETPRVMEERHGLDTPPYEHWTACPCCGGDDFAETMRCDGCGDFITGAYITLRDGSLYCDDCYTQDDL